LAFARYFVFGSGDQWLVVMDGNKLATCQTQGQAVGKAAAMANLMGKMGHDADVMVEDDDALNLAWTYGVDSYPLTAQRRPAAVNSASAA